MQLDLAPLNAIGAAIYILVSVICFYAWRSAGSDGPVGRGWVLVLAFFLCLAVSRLTGLEDIIRETLRSLLRERGSYEDRHLLQVLALAILGVIAITGLFWAQRSTSFNLRSLRSSPLRVAYLASAIMMALIILRIVSLHGVDALLYGGLKLNWVVDLGCAAAVAGAALWSVKAAKRAQ